MTSNKIASLFLVDVQRSSKGKCYLHNSIQCLSKILLRKIIANDGDEAALITFGSSTTNNPLYVKGQDAYEHINILQPFQTVSWTLREAIEALEPSAVDYADPFQAIVVATEMIRTQIKIPKRRFKEIQIFLFSSFTSDISVSNSNRSALLKVLNDYKARLIVVGAEQTTENGSLDVVLDLVKSLPTGKMMSFSECFKNLEQFPQKRRNPREMKISMMIGPINVPVIWVKITEAKKTRIHYGLLCTNDTETYGTGFIRRREVAAKDEDDILLDEEPPEPNEERPHYGGNIPLDTDDAKTVTFMGKEMIISYADLMSIKRVSGPASFTLLGFTKLKNIHRLMFQSTDIYSVKPQNTPESRCLFAAIHNAVLDSGKVPIGRRITMKNGKIMLGALIPAPKPHKCLYFMRLPYAEWIRSAPPVRWTPVPDDSEEMKAVDNYIDTLLLGDDVFTPDKNLQLLNPSYQVACHIIQDASRGLVSNETDELPDNLRRLFTPILNSTEEERLQAVQELNRLFPPPPPKEERIRRRRAAKPEDNDLVLDSNPGVVGRDEEDEPSIKRLKQEILKKNEEEVEAIKAKMIESLPTVNTMDLLDDL